MRAQRAAPLLLACALAAGCASRFQGDAHGAPDYDFSKVRNIALAPNPRRKMPEDAREVRALVEQELRKQLTAKGYRIVPVEEADLLVTFYAGLHAKMRLSGGATPEGTDERMTLQFLEPGSRYSVWYGWAKSTWRESMEPGPEIEKAVTFLLARFPDAGQREAPVPGKTGMEGQVL
ncbi:MAG: DUF4136 domain-containing protein [Myxococcota bacterium]|nr:DUF4136 domain-containing protein [Myxococcota bacterium]